MKAPWIPLIIIGGQWPALLILIIGMERFLAVFKPIYYRANVTNMHRIYAIIASVAIFLLYMSCAYGQRIIFGGEDTPVINTCLVTPTFLPRFDDIHRGIVVFANLAVFFFTLTALFAARRRSKVGAHGDYMRSEVRRINTLIIVAGFCVLQDTIPQLAFWASVKHLFVFPDNTDYFNAVVYYTGSLINFFIYLTMKKEFRTRFVFVFTCGTISNCATGAVASVEPIPANRNNVFQNRRSNRVHILPGGNN